MNHKTMIKDLESNIILFRRNIILLERTLRLPNITPAFTNLVQQNINNVMIAIRNNEQRINVLKIEKNEEIFRSSEKQPKRYRKSSS